MTKGELIKIKIKTTEEFLKSSGTTLEIVKANSHYLLSVFQKKYLELFPTEILSNDIHRINQVAELLRSIQNLDGFNRHIEEYNKTNIGSHLFTARVAKFLSQKGYKITLEPEMEAKQGPHPDIKLEKGDFIGFAECKTSNITNFYGENTKQQIADLVYDKIPTSDQIDLFFKHSIDLNELKEIISSKDFIRGILALYRPNNEGGEARIEVNDSLEVNVIQKPAIIGSENDFPTVRIDGFMEDTSTNTRSIGFSYSKGGRSIGVYEVVDYKNKLKDKMEQSTKQMVQGFPNLVFLRDSDIVGNPEDHKDFINEYWLTPDLKSCSGIVFFENYDSDTDEWKNKISFYPNDHAEIEFKI